MPRSPHENRRRKHRGNVPHESEYRLVSDPLYPRDTRPWSTLRTRFQSCGFGWGVWGLSCYGLCDRMARSSYALCPGETHGPFCQCIFHLLLRPARMADLERAGSMAGWPGALLRSLACSPAREQSGLLPMAGPAKGLEGAMGFVGANGKRNRSTATVISAVLSCNGSVA